MDQGLSVRELARRAGVYPSTVHEAEHGIKSPRLATLQKLADALGVEVAELVRDPSPRGAGLTKVSA